MMKNQPRVHPQGKNISVALTVAEIYLSVITMTTTPQRINPEFNRLKVSSVNFYSCGCFLVLFAGLS